jgi:ATP:cob(I)alamin adenosyltransferase
MSISTRQGDDGYTSLLSGKRVHKFDLRVELLGTMDEVTSCLGLVKSEAEDDEIRDEINTLQQNISIIMSQIAHGSSEKYNVESQEVKRLEALTTKYESMYLGEKGFILPGKTRVSSLMDIARAAVRRTERQLLSIDRFYPVHENCRTYLNRASDFLYAAARFTDFKEEIKLKVKEVLAQERTTATTESFGRRLNLSTAKLLLEKIEQKAEAMKLPVVIAAANEWGNIIAVHFMDGALPGSYSIAVDKAYTAAVLRMTTEDVGRLAQNGQPLYGIENTNGGRIITFGGGCPIMVAGTAAGAVGVSGGSAEQDIELAAYGAGLFSEKGGI